MSPKVRQLAIVQNTETNTHIQLQKPQQQKQL